MSAELLMPLIIILPVFAALLIQLTGKNPNLRETVTLVTSVLLFLLLIPLSMEVFDGARPTITFAEPFPGITLQFTLEPLGMIFSLVAGFLWPVTSIYAIGYMRGHHEKNQTRFYTFFALAIAVTQGVAFSGNLFTLFVFYELLTLPDDDKDWQIYPGGHYIPPIDLIRESLDRFDKYMGPTRRDTGS